MDTTTKKQFIDENIAAIEAEIWKLDTLATALTKAGLTERAEVIAKQSAEQSRVVKALRETIIE